MATPLRFAGLLLLSTALTAPAAIAQTNAGGTAAGGADAPAPADATTGAPAAALPSDAIASGAEQAEEQTPEVSVPGGDIVVTGRRNANIQKSAPAVVSVLSSADIARTGEGNIAGALGRVTGLSVVGNGFVYVRGLGDRYSLALLNGSPLPSPEPLKRVVPLDIFPTNIVSSSLVQKSYSANFPGEFGGGVINLTTSAVPKESFLTVSGGIGANSVTTGRHGYVHYGSATDWTGFDNGSRNIPGALQNYWRSGQDIGVGNSDSFPGGRLAGQLLSSRFTAIQHWGHIAPNFSATISGGTAFDIGDDVRVGIIATGGYSNKWQVRDTLQQFSGDANLSTIDSDFERVTTDNRIVVNALVGLGVEFGENKIRWTNLYIRDTLKNTRLGIGRRDQGTADFMVQDTAWYERQLIDTQAVGEYKLTDQLRLDLRGGYANTQREVPNEFSTEYRRLNDSSPFGPYFMNELRNNTTQVRYSDLSEDLYSASADLSYKPIDEITLSAGYAYTHTRRVSTRRAYGFAANASASDVGLFLLRPDLLLTPDVVQRLRIDLIDLDTTPTFSARLTTNAGYGKIGWQVTPEILIDAGVRYEKGEQNVRIEPVFLNQVASVASQINNDYWLPGGTVTWQFRPDMQVRINASKTIARPQFRELVEQFFFDPDTNRTYTGNRYLKDSRLFNAEARYEWYFARDQRLSVSGFYKKIDNPIESYINTIAGQTVTSFANAPKADLYGAEFETQKYFDMANWSSMPFFETRRLLALVNYTYTKSKLKVTGSDTTQVPGAGNNGADLATNYFRDGASLTGQSDHLVNLQLGLEDTQGLSQQTIIMSYASRRVTSRGLRNTGAAGSPTQPDVYEYPGLNIDFVARQGIDVYGRQVDVKFEARNLTSRKYRELQTNGTNTVVYNRYSPGVTFNFSLSTTF